MSDDSAKLASFCDDDDDTMPLPEASPVSPTEEPIVVDLTTEPALLNPVIYSANVRLRPDADIEYRKVFPTKLKLWKCSRYWFKKCTSAKKKISRLVRQLEKVKKETKLQVITCSTSTQSTVPHHDVLFEKKEDDISDFIFEPDDAWYEEKLCQADQISGIVFQVINH